MEKVIVKPSKSIRDYELEPALSSIINELEKFTQHHRHRFEGKTIVIATHDPVVFEHSFVSKIIAMRNGQIEGVSIN